MNRPLLKLYRHIAKVATSLSCFSLRPKYGRYNISSRVRPTTEYS